MNNSQNLQTKQSGLGWAGEIPEHWEITKIRFVARLESGHTPSRSKPEYWENCDIPWVTTSEIKKFRESERIYLDSTNKQISQLGLENSGAMILPEGTVFLSRTASVGFSGIMAQEMATSQDFVNWVCGDRVIPEYLVYTFRAMGQEFDRLMKGSTHQTIYMPEIRSLEMPLPPVSEQKQIASGLESQLLDLQEVKEKVTNLLSELENKRESIITDYIINGIDQSEFKNIKDSRWYNAIPAGWELLQLNRIRDGRTPIVYGIVQPGPEQDEGVPYIKGGQCEPEFLDPEKLSKTTEEIAEKYSRARLKPGDLVYEIRGSVGRAIIVPEKLAGANLTQDTARISPGEGIDSNWLLYALKSEPFRQQMDLQARGATIEGVNLFDLRRGQLPVPPTREQKMIGQRLNDINSDISESIDAINQFIDLFEEKRRALIMAAVTGQIDVPKAQDESQAPSI
jgi:restriction endonuclease S subunit